MQLNVVSKLRVFCVRVCMCVCVNAVVQGSAQVLKMSFSF